MAWAPNKVATSELRVGTKLYHVSSYFSFLATGINVHLQVHKISWYPQLVLKNAKEAVLKTCDNIVWRLSNDIMPMAIEDQEE